MNNSRADDLEKNLSNNINEFHCEDKKCRGELIYNTNRELVCRECGLVQEYQDSKFVGFQKRAYNKEEVKKRRITEVAWRGFGPRTYINSRKDKSQKNKNDPGVIRRIEKVQNSLINGIERNFWEAKPVLKNYSSNLELPKHVYELAWRIYKRAPRKRLTIGRSIDGFVIASLYSSIRVNNLPYVLEDLIKLSPTDEKQAYKCLKHVIKEILPEFKIVYKPVTPEHLIPRYVNGLNLSLKVQKKTINVLRDSKKNGMRTIGKDPKGIAAGALYYTAKLMKEKKTQKEIAGLIGITEVTLRNRVKQIEKFL